MRSVVEVGEETRSRLEELQAEIRLKTGQTVTQQELLSQLIDDACQSHGEVVEMFRKETVPLTDEEKEAIQRGRFASGTDTEENDIDDKLYGNE